MNEFQPGQLVQAQRFTINKRKVLALVGGNVSVRLHQGCSVADAPWGGRGIRHPDLVITEDTNPRKGKQQTVSVGRAITLGYAKVEP